MQHLLASKFGVKKDIRIRDKSTQNIVDKTRNKTKCLTGDEAPLYFYADGRDLYNEIISIQNEQKR